MSPNAAVAKQPKPDIGTLKETLSAAEWKLAGLHKERDVLTARIREIESEVTEAKAKLANGTASVPAVRNLADQIEGFNQELVLVDEALGTVQPEVDEARNAVQAAEDSAERKRQTEAAREKHETVEALEQQFIEKLAGLLEPLQQRAAIAKTIAKDLPLAPQVEPLTIDGLVDQLREVWRGPDALNFSAANLARLGKNQRIRGWLREIIIGPLYESGDTQALFRAIDLRG